MVSSSRVRCAIRRPQRRSGWLVSMVRWLSWRYSLTAHGSCCLQAYSLTVFVILVNHPSYILLFTVCACLWMRVKRSIFDEEDAWFCHTAKTSFFSSNILRVCHDFRASNNSSWILVLNPTSNCVTYFIRLAHFSVAELGGDFDIIDVTDANGTG